VQKRPNDQNNVRQSALDDLNPCAKLDGAFGFAFIQLLGVAMKVEIDFDKAHDSGELIPIYVGRLKIGDHHGRLYFGPDGKIKMFIEKQAIEDGSIVLLNNLGSAVGLGPMPSDT